jgi:hypothetical protein
LLYAAASELVNHRLYKVNHLQQSESIHPSCHIVSKCITEIADKIVKIGKDKTKHIMITYEKYSMYW